MKKIINIIGFKRILISLIIFLVLFIYYFILFSISVQIGWGHVFLGVIVFTCISFYLYEPYDQARTKEEVLKKKAEVESKEIERINNRSSEEIFDDYMEEISNKIKERPKGLGTAVENAECLLLLDGMLEYLVNHIQNVISFPKLDCGFDNPFVIRNPYRKNITIPIQYWSRRSRNRYRAGYSDDYIVFPSIVIFKRHLNERPAFLKLQNKCKDLGFSASFAQRPGLSSDGHWELLINYENH